MPFFVLSVGFSQFFWSICILCIFLVFLVLRQSVCYFYRRWVFPTQVKSITPCPRGLALVPIDTYPECVAIGSHYLKSEVALLVKPHSLRPVVVELDAPFPDPNIYLLEFPLPSQVNLGLGGVSEVLGADHRWVSELDCVAFCLLCCELCWRFFYPQIKFLTTFDPNTKKNLLQRSTKINLYTYRRLI